MLLKKLLKRPLIFQRLSGLTIAQFDSLVEKARPAWKKKIEAKKVSGRPTKIGGLDGHVLLLLVYYRCHISYVFAGYLFGLDDSNVCRALKRVEPVVLAVTKIRKQRSVKPSEVEAILIDCTEQAIQRPKRQQKKYYSGKKKQHTIKFEIQTTAQGKILSVSKPYPGSVHDFAIRKKEIKLPDNVPIFADGGYQGLRELNPNARTPVKKGKNQPLTDLEKCYNKALSQRRIKVENTIGKMKQYKILSDRYRCRRKGYNVKTQIIAGIVNRKSGF